MNLYELSENLHSDDTLFIVGNGFDLSHGVNSSYYDFRDSLKRNDEIRFVLKTYINTQNLWGDFENNLAYLDRAKIISALDDEIYYMDVKEEYDDDFSAADYFATIDMLLRPADVLLYDMPKKFRKWICSLKTPEPKDEFKKLLSPDFKYITFNYTEFLETVYKIPNKKVFYLHGNRMNKKECLVLGHGRDEDEIFDEWYNANKYKKEYRPFRYGKKGHRYRNDNPVYLAYFLRDETKGNWKSQMRYDMINNVVSRIEEYYSNSAKKTKDVIEKFNFLFGNLSNIKNIVVLGHSLSDVDMPYFERILCSSKEAKWFIGFHSDKDIERINNFMNKFGLLEKQISIFKL